MKRIFLTSGLVICLACPAFANDITPAGKDAQDTTVDADCTVTYTGQTENNSTATLEAIWNANKSGAITLDSNRYATSDAAAAASTASTAAAPTPLYSIYDTGIYSDANATTAVTALSTTPVMTGYTFAGFYTGKAGSGTQVIDGNSAILAAASTQVTTTNGTATWYAHWTAQQYGLVYQCGTASNNGVNHSVGGVAPVDNTTYAYDSVITTLANNAGTCAEPGYTFAGWSCNNNGVTATAGADGIVANNGFTWNQAGAITCVAQWTPNTIGLTWNTNGGTVDTAGGESCTYDGGIVLPTNPTKTGYTFTGWTVSSTTPAAAEPAETSGN